MSSQGPKIAIIGAGSSVFAKNIIGDALCFPSLSHSEFALMDIDAARLEESRQIAAKLAEEAGGGARISAHQELEGALKGADFALICFQIGGYEPSTVIDFSLPRKFGLRQTIGDTLGIGGIMRFMRTAPALFDVAEAMRQFCPEAWLVNFVNPMAMNMWALERAFPDIKAMGLCHSVQNTVLELAHDLDMEPGELRYKVAGVNHVAFFLELTDSDGNDLYPRLKAGYEIGELPKPPLLMPRCQNLVRYEVMRHFGYFCTESSEHLAEYLPWFIKSGREDLIKDFAIPLDEYPKRCIEQREEWQSQFAALAGGGAIHHQKSHELAADILNALITGEPLVSYINMPNQGQIPQLPPGAIVETPCLVDASGVQPTLIADIPAGLRAIINAQISVQELAVEGVLAQDLRPIINAAQMDPHMGAELDLRQIEELVREMADAHVKTGFLAPYDGEIGGRCGLEAVS